MVKKLKENEIVLDVDNDEKFDELVDAIQDIADDDAGIDIVDNDTENNEETVDDSGIIEEPLDDNNDGIDEPEVSDNEDNDDKEVTVNGDPVDDDEELLVEEGDEVVDAGGDDTGASLDDVNAEAGAEITEELEITDYADPEDIGEFFGMTKKETEDELADPEETIDDICDEEEPSGLMKEDDEVNVDVDVNTNSDEEEAEAETEVVTEDVNDELVDATPRSIPAGLDTVKGKIMSIAEELNGLTELTDDVETTSIIADLYNSAVALALDVEGAVDTYKELAEEEIEDEVDEVKGEESAE